MLPTVPHKYRTEGDDSAPRDYRYVASVAEGTRHRQGQSIHPQTDAPPSAQQPGEPGKPSAYRIPRASDGPAPAVSVAYPRPRSNAFARTPDFAPRSPAPLAQAETDDTRALVSAAYAPNTAQETPAVLPADASTPDGAAPVGYRRARRTTATIAQESISPKPSAEYACENRPVAPAHPPAEVPPYAGEQYAPPPAQEIPDWLQAARQNQTVSQHPRPPQVQPAPRQAPSPALDPLGRPILRGAQQGRAATYADAGYPPQLVAQQYDEEAQTAVAPDYVRVRHGASYAAPQPPPAIAAPHSIPSSYPPPREATTTAQPYRRNAPPPEVGAPLSQPPRDNPYYALQPEDASPYQVLREERSARRRDPQTEEPEADAADADAPKRNIPYLGIAVFLAAMLVVTLIILQTTFTQRKAAVMTARTAAQVELLETHQYAYRELIEREASANNLHPAFVAAIIYNESSFNPSAESSVGARGLMQMMPDTAEWVHGKIDADTAYSFDLMYDADKNVTYACWYLAYLSNRFHSDPVLVAAAFHAGQTTVENWLTDSRYSADSQTIELENMAEGPTKNYATRIMNSFAIYRRLYYEGGAEALQASGAVSAS